MRLADAQQRIPHNDVHGQLIFDAIREGLWPFRAHIINVWTEYDIDRNEQKIVAEVRLMSGYTIAYIARANARDLADNLYGEVFRIAWEMRDAFRNREDFYDLPPLIYLGEN